MKNLIGNKTVKAITTNDSWNRLRILDLSENSITDLGAIAFGGQIKCFNLVRLGLSGNQLSDECIFYIKSNPFWQYTLEVDRGGEVFDQIFVQYLRDQSPDYVEKPDFTKWNCNDMWTLIFGRVNPHLKDMDKLHIKNCNLTDISGFVFCSNTNWENLQELNLSNNHISDVCAAALGENSTWTKLTVLVLSFNNITDEGGA